ncbi:probable glutathione S-transferase parC isoform X1 [Diospyros lotus]|uniref:probable glutathione S-transferase parC isoform X1 n=1 Tax=Diospyros lotus TaxID=55363 RepID=UPI00225587DF|nr:probable glutathione S-transferase parC isoform X1 [Diospyros lotus]
MNEKDELILLNSWASPFGARVRIAMAEKGINQYELREEDLFSMSPLLLKMNPVHRKVPVLIHNGKPICESMNIVQYIDEVAVFNGKPALLPPDPYSRSKARFWADFIDQKVYGTMRKITRNRGEEQVRAKEELIETLKVLERELGEKPYFGGEFGFVDIALVPFYSRFYAVETLGNFRIEAECPKLVAWARRCLLKETVSNSLPDPLKVYEWVLYVNDKFGIKQN